MTYKRVTLKEISKKLNLSVSTISAILNNNPNCFASKKTREKVFKVVYELGYKPNLIARSLRKRKTNTIGFIAPILNIGVTLSDIEILEELAWEKGYSLIIGYSKSNPEIEEKILEEFYNRNVDGIILIPTGIKSENNFLKRLLKINFPI
ncbi:MAG: LacI family transcriptional regulator, partial [bacterium]|nr:LacI family transcriptional regulator [bacterium]MDW8164353.1 LacI family DNA-binding transcriptional regulator [Candidatus Omnitrophota bacterium]